MAESPIGESADFKGLIERENRIGRDERVRNDIGGCCFQGPARAPRSKTMFSLKSIKTHPLLTLGQRDQRWGGFVSDLSMTRVKSEGEVEGDLAKSIFDLNINVFDFDENSPT